MLKRIKEVNPLSAAETLGFFFSFIGFLFGVFYSFLLLLKVKLDFYFEFFYPLIESLKLEAFSLLLFPLFYLLVGFILGAILSFLYNLASKVSNNGIEILTDE